MRKKKVKTPPAAAGLAVIVLFLIAVGLSFVISRPDDVNHWRFGYEEPTLPITTIGSASRPPTVRVSQAKPAATSTATTSTKTGTTNGSNRTDRTDRTNTTNAPKETAFELRLPARASQWQAGLPPGSAQGSFTELFSGTGWKDEADSDAYHDQKTLTISLPPAYRWEAVPEMTVVLAPADIAAVGGNGREVVVITKSGEAIAFRSETGAVGGRVSLTPAGFRSSVLAYDASANRWAAVFAGDGGSRAVLFEVQAAGVVVISKKQITVDEVPDPQVTSLACAAGQCLVVLRSASGDPQWAAYRFGGASVPGAERESVLDDITRGPALVSLSVGAAGDSFVVGATTKGDGSYAGSVYLLVANTPALSLSKGSNPFSTAGLEPLDGAFFTSEYAGDVVFGYDAHANNVLAVYGAGVGQAALINLRDGAAEDYSRFFNRRVLATGADDSPGVTFAFFRQGDAWWGSSTLESPLPKLLRIQSGVGSDLTGDVIGSRSAMIFVPGLAPNVVYGIGSSEKGSSVWRLTNRGFDASRTVRWESSKLNPPGTDVIGAILRSRDDGGGAAYLFSNDGGAAWVRAALGDGIVFTQQGTDFRFRVELAPGPDPSKSPWVHRVEVSYYYISK
jgi:hypothetical protein